MQEAKDYDRVENVEQFLGAIVDRCFDAMKNCPVTSSFTLFIDLVSNLSRRRLPSSWNEAESGELDEMIKMFKRQTRHTFGKYQPSWMGTSNFHLLHHISEDIEAFESINYLSEGLYEYTY